MALVDSTIIGWDNVKHNTGLALKVYCGKSKTNKSQ